MESDVGMSQDPKRALVFSGEALNPKALNPKALNPKALNPKALNPKPWVSCLFVRG